MNLPRCRHETGHRFRPFRAPLFILLLLAAAPAVAAAQEAGDVPDELEFLMEETGEDLADAGPEVADPIAPWNKAMHHFNDRLYFWLLKPAATGYKAVTPEIARKGLQNFFTNLATPIRFVGCLLQGKSERAGVELGRFMVNTTVGVGGFGDPASLEPSLQVPPAEDVGQAFGVWGVGSGFYIVWPVLGPSTLRDSISAFGESFLSPLNYVDPAAAGIGARALDQVNDTSFQLGDYEELKKAALDPYVAIRNGFIQRRKGEIAK
jgi:phospholipid-binding lipoprotein MlaA